MNALIKMLVTIIFGWLGLHKFLEEKPLQGFMYMVTFGLLAFGWIIDIVSSVQNFKKKSLNEIKKTSKTLGIIFSLLLLLYCFGSIGTENFSRFSFFLCLVSAISIIKLYIIDNQINSYSYEKSSNNNYDKQSTNNFSDEPMNIRLNFGVESNNDYDLMNTNINYLTGKYYDENEIILDKYKNLKTPNYVIVQINEQLHPKGNMYYLDDMIELSNKFKDKYLNHADFFPFKSYWAQIRDLNEYQLKWYLYWRKEFLNNNILDTDISYIFIFAYELVCYTFNQNASFNISALDRLYNSYKDLYPNLVNYLPQWIDDMLSEVGYYYALTDADIKEISEDSLVNSLTTLSELDKININIWRKHYSERKSELNNKQLSLIYGNQKFNNRLKKYAGLLAKYYIDNKVDIINQWFEIKIITEKKSLFNGVPCALQRMEGTYKYKKYFSNSNFEHDMNQITKLCYDLLYPQNEMDENDYVISQYQNGKYELPEDFFYSNFKKKSKKIEVDIEVRKEKQKEFKIDISKINDYSTKIKYIEKGKEELCLESEEKEFINKFDNGILDRKIAQQYCVKKGKMLNAYINSLNEKYFPIIHKELVIIENDILRLNMELEDNGNDK